MSTSAFERVKQLVREKRFNEAHNLLMMMSHDPTAQRWLQKLDELIAAESPSTPQPIEKVLPEEMDEVRDFHPLVAVWLAQHGYQFEHEVRLKNGIRVDFLATHMSTKQRLAVECKINITRPDDFRKAIVQATDYEVNIAGNVQAALAIPANQVRDGWEKLCDRHQVQLILIDTSSIEIYQPPAPEPVRANPSIIQSAYVRGYREISYPSPTATMQPSAQTSSMSNYHRYGFWIGFNALLTPLFCLTIALSEADEMLSIALGSVFILGIINGFAWFVLWLVRNTFGWLKTDN